MIFFRWKCTIYGPRGRNKVMYKIQVIILSQYSPGCRSLTWCRTDSLQGPSYALNFTRSSSTCRVGSNAQYTRSHDRRATKRRLSVPDSVTEHEVCLHCHLGQLAHAFLSHSLVLPFTSCTLDHGPSLHEKVETCTACILHITTISF